MRKEIHPNDYSHIEGLARAWAGPPDLKASVVVASFNQKDTLKLNLLSWNHQTYPKALFEIIVADDGSSDGTGDMVEALEPRLDYAIKYFTQEDRGFRLAKVRNEGVKRSVGEVVFFVDGDTIPGPEYLLEHMRYYHVADNVAVIGMRHRIPPDVEEDTVAHRKGIEALQDLPMLEDAGAPEEVKAWRKNVLFDNVAFRRQWPVWGGFHGTLGSCRRQDYLGVGGNDEGFTVYGQEDSEFGYRLMAKVQYLVSNPRARLYHLEHPDNPRKLDPKNKALLKEKTTGPALSLILPVQNRAEKVGRWIEGLLEGRGNDVELLVVDDGSTDGTPSALEPFRYHPRVRLFKQDRQGEQTAADLVRGYARGRRIRLVKRHELAGEAPSLLHRIWRRWFGKPPRDLPCFCPICGSKVKAFLPYGVVPRPNADCPVCHAKERHRLIWLYFQERTNLLKNRLRVLHVAPEAVISKLLRKQKNLDYLSGDLEAGKAMIRVDLTDIQYPEGSFDVVYASHVFEHIPDDRKAMVEVRRVLAPGGWAVLQVPLFGETTYEDFTITSPEEREKAFGQKDHVRKYGRDYKERLEEAGFKVTVDPYVSTLGPEKIRRYGLMESEDIYYCEK